MANLWPALTQRNNNPQFYAHTLVPAATINPTANGRTKSQQIVWIFFYFFIFVRIRRENLFISPDVKINWVFSRCAQCAPHCDLFLFVLFSRLRILNFDCAYDVRRAYMDSLKMLNLLWAPTLTKSRVYWNLYFRICYSILFYFSVQFSAVSISQFTRRNKSDGESFLPSHRHALACSTKSCVCVPIFHCNCFVFFFVAHF